MDENEPKSIITDESSIDESESKCVHKDINKEKEAKNEAEDEEPMVPDDTIVVKDPIYYNIFECGKNLLDMLDATCDRACMATP